MSQAPHIKIPSELRPLYHRARAKRMKLLGEGKEVPIFDIMADMRAEEKELFGDKEKRRGFIL